MTYNMNGDVLEEVQKYGDYEAVISRKVTGDELVSVCIRHFLCVSCYFRVYRAIFLCIMLFSCVSCYFRVYHTIFLCIMLFTLTEFLIINVSFADEIKFSTGNGEGNIFEW